jgi:hypothetical protein
LGAARERANELAIQPFPDIAIRAARPDLIERKLHPMLKPLPVRHEYAQ